MADIGLLLIRLVFGLSFAGYGLQTLFGRLGGDGLDGTAAFYESVGLKPGRPLALLAGLAELAGGISFAVGLLTPLAGVTISVVMFVAIVAVNAQDGYWVLYSLVAGLGELLALGLLYGLTLAPAT